ncbi:MAG: peptidyl-prolyl cis-trans isomerase [Armatimonadota bacterium]|nr:peptidyl-prolyl cis-trans isomerase [Armatimonadota bacterium]
MRQTRQIADFVARDGRVKGEDAFSTCCAVSAALHVVAVVVLLILGLAPVRPALPRLVDVEILPGAKPGPKAVAGASLPRRASAAARPHSPPKEARRPPTPPMQPRRRPSPPQESGTVWAAGLKLPRPAPTARREVSPAEESTPIHPGEAFLPPPTAPPPDLEAPGDGGDVIAVYAGGQITRQQFNDYLRAEVGADLSQLEGPEPLKIRFAHAMLERMVCDEMMLRDAEERGLSQREGVKRALRRLTEDENIAELAERIGARIEVTNAEISAYYEQHKEELKDAPLASVRDLIADILRREKARAAFEAYLERLKRQAVIVRNFAVLDAPSPPAAAVIFSVNGRDFTVAHWQEELKALTAAERAALADKETRTAVLESLIVRTLLLEAASSITDADTRNRIEHIRRLLLLSVLQQEEVDSKIQVTEEEVSARYEEVKGEWRVAAQARIALVGMPRGRTEEEQERARALMEEIRTAIATGAGFEATAGRFRPQAPEVQASDDSGWINEFDHLEDLRYGLCAFHLRVFKTVDVGALSDVFEYRNRLYLIRVLEREPGRTPRPEEIAPLLRAELYARKRAEAQGRYLDRLMERANLQVRQEALSEMARSTPPE